MSLIPKAPTKVGTQTTAVKKPKAKKMPSAFGKKSLFFKSEDFGVIKKESIRKLLEFLKNHQTKNQEKSNS